MGDFFINVLLVLIGLSAGMIIAGGLFAFIVMIGVVTRLISRTKTAKSVRVYEDLVVLGATIGNAIFIFQIHIPIGMVGLLLFGGFSGVFVGCLAAALAETVQVIPVFSNRIKLKAGIPVIILSMALAKSLGSLYQLFFMWKPN